MKQYLLNESISRHFQNIRLENGSD